MSGRRFSNPSFREVTADPLPIRQAWKAVWAVERNYYHPRGEAMKDLYNAIPFRQRRDLTRKAQRILRKRLEPLQSQRPFYQRHMTPCILYGAVPETGWWYVTRKPNTEGQNLIFGEVAGKRHLLYWDADRMDILPDNALAATKHLLGSEVDPFALMRAGWMKVHKFRDKCPELTLSKHLTKAQEDVFTTLLKAWVQPETTSERYRDDDRYNKATLKALFRKGLVKYLNNYRVGITAAGMVLAQPVIARIEAEKAAREEREAMHEATEAAVLRALRDTYNQLDVDRCDIAVDWESPYFRYNSAVRLEIFSPIMRALHERFYRDLGSVEFQGEFERDDQERVTGWTFKEIVWDIRFDSTASNLAEMNVIVSVAKALAHLMVQGPNWTWHLRESLVAAQKK